MSDIPSKICRICNIEKLPSEFYHQRRICASCYSKRNIIVQRKRKDKVKSVVIYDINLKETPEINIESSKEVNNELSSFDQFAAYIGLAPGNDNIEAGYIYFKYWLWCRQFNLTPENKHSYNRHRMKTFKCIKGRGTTFYKLKGVNFFLNEEEKALYIRWRNKEKRIKERRELSVKNLSKGYRKAKEDQRKNPELVEETPQNILDLIKVISQE